MAIGDIVIFKGKFSSIPERSVGIVLDEHRGLCGDKVRVVFAGIGKRTVSRTRLLGSR